MRIGGSDGSPAAMLDRLAGATNSHDVDRLVDCFTDDYRNETPAHPSRSFTGREQVRRNWTQIFTAVPDLRATVLRSASVGDTVWSEWEMTGTRHDGTTHLMRGVILFGVDAGRACWARFYLEPVVAGDETVDSAVSDQVRGAR
jgi:ketosteroid isomerase-like protein